MYTAPSEPTLTPWGWKSLAPPMAGPSRKPGDEPPYARVVTRALGSSTLRTAALEKSAT